MAEKDYRGISEPRQEFDRTTQEDGYGQESGTRDEMFGDALDREAERRFSQAESEQEEENGYDDYDPDDKAVEDMTFREGFNILMTQKKMAVLFTVISVVLILIIALNAVGVLPKIAVRVVTLGFAAICIIAYLAIGRSDR